jgi:hypothetical protein
MAEDKRKKRTPSLPALGRKKKTEEVPVWTRDDFLRDLQRATRRVEKSEKERA